MIGAETTVNLTGRRLMLVDDESDFVTTTEMLLSEHTGAMVSAFTSPATALSAFESVNPECLITDMVMPGFTGLELIQKLTRRRPDLPCLLVTGNALNPMDMAAHHLPQLRSVLFKPISWTQLAEAVEQALKTQPEDDQPKSFYTPVGRWK